LCFGERGFERGDAVKLFHNTPSLFSITHAGSFVHLADHAVTLADGLHEHGFVGVQRGRRLREQGFGEELRGGEGGEHRISGNKPYPSVPFSATQYPTAIADTFDCLDDHLLVEVPPFVAIFVPLIYRLFPSLCAGLAGGGELG